MVAGIVHQVVEDELIMGAEPFDGHVGSVEIVVAELVALGAVEEDDLLGLGSAHGADLDGEIGVGLYGLDHPGIRPFRYGYSRPAEHVAGVDDILFRCSAIAVAIAVYRSGGGSSGCLCVVRNSVASYHVF
ncbi:MAG: hypothetical protein KDD02_11600 [Phaeodactylibacter sp.]|nr:hypothetical protein [Phaeodactylibacter sp.]